MLDNSSWRREVDFARKVLSDSFGRDDTAHTFALSELRRLLTVRDDEGERRVRKMRLQRSDLRPAPMDERIKAMEAAALVMGIAPELVTAIQKKSDCHAGRSKLGQDIHRAKAYAAFALRALYPDNYQTDYGMWVRHSNPQNFMSQLDLATKYNNLRWWNNDKFMSVIEAVERFVEEKKRVAERSNAQADTVCGV
jgi:hypothetical protein